MSFNPGGSGGISGASDVALNNPASDESLAYDAATQKWRNKSLTAGSVASSDITDSTTTGRALITASSAASARSAIGAGTSSLVIGTTSSSAKRGDYVPFVKVIHGSNASVARPSADYVLWEGSVQPANWINGDDWNEVA